MITLLAISTVLYAVLLAFARTGWQRLSRFHLVHQTIDWPSISVVVPFRNEVHHIPHLIRDLAAQQHLPFEVILVNDHSDDDSFDTVETLLKTHSGFILLTLPPGEEGKKSALNLGIETAKGKFIATVDADVRLSEGWLKTLSVYIAADQPDMLILPLNVINPSERFIGFFQQVENLAIQAISMGCAAMNRPVSCNGANLVFRKEAFIQSGGYQAHTSVASGDDVLLMQQLTQQGYRIRSAFDPELIGRTAAVSTYAEALNQRLRWAGKSGRMLGSAASVAGLILMIHSLVLLLSLVFASMHLAVWLLFALKIVLDVLLINYTAQRYQQRLNVLKLAWAAVLYVVVLPTIALLSAMWKPEWKARRI